MLKNFKIRLMILILYLCLRMLRWGAGGIKENTATDILLVLIKLLLQDRGGSDERSNEKVSGSDFVVEFFNNDERFFVYYQAKVVKFSRQALARDRKPIVKLGHITGSVDVIDLSWELFGFSPFRILRNHPDLIIRWYNLQIINQFLYCISNGFFPSYCFYANWGKNECGTKFRMDYTLTHSRTIDIILGFLEEKKDFSSQIEFFNIKGLRSYHDEIRPDMGGYFFPEGINELAQAYSFFADGWTEQNITKIKEYMINEVIGYFDKLNFFEQDHQEEIQEIKKNYIKKIEALVKVTNIPKLDKANEVKDLSRDRVIRIRI